MRKHLLTLLIISIFAAGLSVLLYPYAGEYVTALRQSRVVGAYRDTVAALDEEDCTGLLETARTYNESLVGKRNRFILSEDEWVEYESLLNFTEGGVIGTLEIGRIGVRLPIYHGAGESALEMGIGHLEGSSLPVGGPGTHSILTGHRGLPSSILLTNMDRLSIGDTFALYVLGEILAYQVDRILVVEPDELGSLIIVPGEDYCTLITCTPYGINTHRLLVHGHRTDPALLQSWEEPIFQVFSSVKIFDNLPAILIVLLLVAAARTALLVVRPKKIYGRGKKQR